MNPLWPLMLVVGLPLPHAVIDATIAAGGRSERPALVETNPKRAIWVTIIACRKDGVRDERPPHFNPHECASISERVFIDGDVPVERTAYIEDLSIEDVALKLERLLGGDSADSGTDGGD